MQGRPYSLLSLNHLPKIFANLCCIVICHSPSIHWMLSNVFISSPVCMHLIVFFSSLSFCLTFNKYSRMVGIFIKCVHVPISHTYQNCSSHLLDWCLCVFQQVNLQTFFVSSVLLVPQCAFVNWGPSVILFLGTSKWNNGWLAFLTDSS